MKTSTVCFLVVALVASFATTDACLEMIARMRVRAALAVFPQLADEFGCTNPHGNFGRNQQGGFNNNPFNQQGQQGQQPSNMNNPFNQQGQQGQQPSNMNNPFNQRQMNQPNNPMNGQPNNGMNQPSNPAQGQMNQQQQQVPPTNN